MGRKRLIDESVFCSADLLDMPATARLLWIGLIVLADETGLIQCRSDAYLKAKLLPCLDVGRVKLSRFIEDFKAKRMLSVTEAAGISCWKLTNWSKYQHFKRVPDTPDCKVSKGKVREGIRKDTPPPPDSEPGSVTVELRDPQGVLDRLTKPPFKLGGPKACDYFERHKYTTADLDAWEEVFKVRGGSWLGGNLPHYKNPAEVPEDPKKSGFDYEKMARMTMEELGDVEP